VCRFLALFLTLLLIQPTVVGRNKVYSTKWANLSNLLAEESSLGRRLQVRLLDSRTFTLRVLAVEEDALLVESTRHVAEWDAGNKQARIPRHLVVSVHRSRMSGKGPMIGLLSGAALGAVAAASPSTKYSDDPRVPDKPSTATERAAFGIPLMAFLGFMVGYACSRQHIEYRILP